MPIINPAGAGLGRNFKINGEISNTGVAGGRINAFDLVEISTNSTYVQDSEQIFAKGSMALNYSSTSDGDLFVRSTSNSLYLGIYYRDSNSKYHEFDLSRLITQNPVGETAANGACVLDDDHIIVSYLPVSYHTPVVRFYFNRENHSFEYVDHVLVAQSLNRSITGISVHPSGKWILCCCAFSGGLGFQAYLYLIGIDDNGSLYSKNSNYISAYSHAYIYHFSPCGKYFIGHPTFDDVFYTFNENTGDFSKFYHERTSYSAGTSGDNIRFSCDGKYMLTFHDYTGSPSYYLLKFYDITSEESILSGSIFIDNQDDLIEEGSVRDAYFDPIYANIVHILINEEGSIIPKSYEFTGNSLKRIMKKSFLDNITPYCRNMVVCPSKQYAIGYFRIPNSYVTGSYADRIYKLESPTLYSLYQDESKTNQTITTPVNVGYVKKNYNAGDYVPYKEILSIRQQL